MMENELVWNTEKEIGYFPVPDTGRYDDGYYEECAENSRSPISNQLEDFRIQFVNSYTKGLVLDIGIGVGEFIRRRKNCFGYDICPKAVKWLTDQGVYFDPYLDDVDLFEIEGITFFDSFEHIRDLRKLLNRINDQYVFISIPIFRDLAHILHSKHFKPREHYWYFTQKSIRELMATEGLEILECRNDEILIGREDIWTFVFRRGR